MFSQLLIYLKSKKLRSSISTVHRKSSTLKRKKPIGAITSGEREVYNSAFCCANAGGQFLPLILIFKCIRENRELGNDLLKAVLLLFQNLVT